MDGLFSFHGETAPRGQDLLIIEASLAYTPHSVGLLWTSDQLDVETFTLKYTHWQETDSHDPVGFEPPIPASELTQIHSLDDAATGIGVGGLFEWIF
jgi:hypothetical protein